VWYAFASLVYIDLVIDPSVPEVVSEDGSEAGERRPTPNILPPAEFIFEILNIMVMKERYRLITT
jgi:hypothetical protein